MMLGWFKVPNCAKEGLLSEDSFPWLVYIALATLSSDSETGRSVVISKAKLAAKFKVTERVIGTALAKLEAWGEIAITKQVKGNVETNVRINVRNDVRNNVKNASVITLCNYDTYTANLKKDVSTNVGNNVEIDVETNVDIYKNIKNNKNNIPPVIDKSITVPLGAEGESLFESQALPDNDENVTKTTPPAPSSDTLFQDNDPVKAKRETKAQSEELKAMALKLYKNYPTVDPKSGRRIAKGSKDKEKIERLLKTKYTTDELTKIFDWYIKIHNEQGYFPDLAKFLNNLPELSEITVDTVQGPETTQANVPDRFKDYQ